MEKQKAHQVAFLTTAFGGPAVYHGRTMAEAHAALIRDKGLNETHFDLVAGHLVASLEELKVEDDLIAEVLELVAPLRSIFEAPKP